MSEEDKPRAVPPVAPAPPRARLSRWLKAVLVVSVALNLLVLGAIGSHFFKWGRGDRFLPGDDWAQSRSFIRAIPNNRRQEIFAEIQTQREELRQARRTVSQARQRVREALREGQNEDYQKIFKSLADAESDALRQFRNIMADVAGRLTEKERKRLARHLMRRKYGH